MTAEIQHSQRTTTTSNSHNAETIELTENFYINNSSRRNNVKIQVKLNGNGIYLRRETEQTDHINEQLIKIEDIIGSRCGPRQKKRVKGGLSSCKRITEQDDNEEQTTTSSKVSEAQKDTSAFLYIYAYVKREQPLQRNRTVRILRFRTFERYEDNLKAAERWHLAIRQYKGEIMEESTQQHKHLLVLLNPKSGMGKGREMFQKQVAPVLKETDISYDLQVTTHANYARELVRTRKDLVEHYSGIVVAAGDGLFHEVLNGLMDRADWRTVLRQVPLGIIPCGSGNGLAKSISHHYKEPYEPKPIQNATLTCVAGRSSLMDIVRVEMATPQGKRSELYSFLSVGWGLIADIDIESERLRSIGNARFTIWSLHRVFRLRTNKGKLYYLPWQKAEHAHELSKATKQQEVSQQTRKSAPSNSQEFYDLPENNVDEGGDEFADAVSLDHSTSRSQMDSWHSAASRRTAYYSIAGNSIRSRRGTTASMHSKIEAANAEFEMLAPVSTIPPLNMPLPMDSNWRCEEGEFVMVQAAYTSHLASDCHFVPDAKLDDGIINLVIIRKGVGRAEVAKFLLAMSSGTHMPETHHEFIQMIPVRAFRIEPSGTEGIMNVDGERVSYGPIQAEIFPSMLKVMVPIGK